MPSPYTSSESQEDAENLASNFKIKFKSIPIVDAIKAYEIMLSSEFQGLTPDVTEENLQARIRANILMALSNKFGRLVLTTGNKSEAAKLLNITRTTLNNKIKKYSIQFLQKDTLVINGTNCLSGSSGAA